MHARLMVTFITPNFPICSRGNFLLTKQGSGRLQRARSASGAALRPPPLPPPPPTLTAEQREHLEDCGKWQAVLELFASARRLPPTSTPEEGVRSLVVAIDHRAVSSVERS